MAEIKWTTDLPTGPGWYWMRKGNGNPTMIVKVAFAGSDYALIAVPSVEGLCEAHGGQEWAGPIPAPKEADRA